MRKIINTMTLGLAALLLAGCGEPPPDMRTIELTTNVIRPPGVEGPVEVRVFHAWFLEGNLRHPLHLIEIFPARDGDSFTDTFEYRHEMGDDLAVFAWIDTDGDGIHCTPTVRDDPSGLTVVEDGDATKLEVTVNVTEPCRAPNWFYPTAS
ncbi:MAG: hypothetical protein QNJ73_08350 [Gammaproteobacteria bacterium]|nr:hypothetical protein [Gammaproteobacteria bacterium]